MFEIYCDGACTPHNPGGAMRYGFVVKRNGETIHTESGGCQAHPNNTNNRAEYIAIGMALRWLIDNGHTAAGVTIYSDSKLIVNQLTGRWRCSSDSIYRYWWRAKDLYDQTDATVTWIPREKNVQADSLTRERT